MNIKEAKAIPLAQVLEKMGAIPSRQTEHDIWYPSVFRQENTASLHVHPGKNVWYDFGEGKGGNGIDLVCAYLQATGENATVVDALRWLRNMVGNPQPVAYNLYFAEGDTGKGWGLKGSKPIEHLALVRYLEKRGIPLVLAKRHLKQVYVQSRETGKGMFALGFCNEDGGYELRNPFCKSCIAPKTVTFIRGSVPKPDSIHLFEGFMDYLSEAANCEAGELEGDSIVLNSLSCLKDAWPYIKGYGYRTLYSWMDNDAAGTKATAAIAEFVKAEADLLHKPMNEAYAPHKDVNACRMHRLGLSL